MRNSKNTLSGAELSSYFQIRTSPKTGKPWFGWEAMCPKRMIELFTDVLENGMPSAAQANKIIKVMGVLRERVLA